MLEKNLISSKFHANDNCLKVTVPQQRSPVKFGFTKSQRMLGAKDYERVFSSPTSRVSNKYLLLLAKQVTLPYTRMGLVISKKNVGCAVARNRIKRLCREAFRQHQKDFVTIDIVFLARPGIKSLSNTLITEMINNLLDKLAIEQSKLQ